jgi:hypothetical protein
MSQTSGHSPSKKIETKALNGEEISATSSLWSVI